MIRSASAAATALALVGLSAQGGDAATPDPARTPIRHLVVMTQDQRSFDNYFGARSGVDGIPDGVCVPAKGGQQHALRGSVPAEGVRASAEPERHRG